MKSLGGLAFLFLSIVHFSTASATTFGECKAVETSKRYIEFDFRAPFPKSASFSCEYVCRGTTEEVIRGTHRVRLASIADEATMTTCQGIRLVRTEYGYDFDQTASFYAHAGKTPEVKVWAEKNVKFQSPLESHYLLELKKKLTYVVSNYAMMDPAYIQSFGVLGAIKRLQSIVDELPESDHTLEVELDNIRANLEKSPSPQTEDFWVQSALKSAAAWRLPLNQGH